jgi:hypothetical protein
MAADEPVDITVVVPVYKEATVRPFLARLSRCSRASANATRSCSVWIVALPPEQVIAEEIQRNRRIKLVVFCGASVNPRHDGRDRWPGATRPA